VTRPALDPGAAIQALREHGAERLEPLRLGIIEALARRASSHQGRARQWLDERLATLLADCQARLTPGRRSPATVPAPAPTRSPLADLLAQLGSGPGPGPGEPGAPRELNAMRHHRPTWARLSADLRLAQSSAQAPENAGPLNSQALALRSLKLMRDVSPAYLNRFMAYFDALLWLEQAQGDTPLVAKAAARGDGEPSRKTARKTPPRKAHGG